MLRPVVETGAIDAHKLITNSWVPLPAFGDTMGGRELSGST